jgi:hypothetical protein
MVKDPATTPDNNAASEGIARMCGASSTPILILATLGVTVAMGTAVALIVVPKRADVAKMTGFANLGLAFWMVGAAFNASRECLPIGVMAASLPLLVGIASVAASILQARRKADGPEANSG